MPSYEPSHFSLAPRSSAMAADSLSPTNVFFSCINHSKLLTALRDKVLLKVLLFGEYTAVNTRVLAVVAGVTLLAQSSFAATLKVPTSTVIYSFTGGADGYFPVGDLIRDPSGNFYGVTYGGGTYNNGTVYKITSGGSHVVLHSFSVSEGFPQNGVVRDPSGNLYGVTSFGGADGHGIIYKLSADGSLSLIYAFTGGSDGANPVGPLLLDSKGDLYGVGAAGGTSGGGCVFEFSPDGHETVLHGFTGSDGATPESGLISYNGNMFGTTKFGGSSDNGTVFQISKLGVFKSLLSFNSVNGQFPAHNRLTHDAAGNLYGATQFGGSSQDGVVFKLAPDGTETVIHSFTGGADGIYPSGNVVPDRSGAVYGATTLGGHARDGIAFKIAPDGSETILPFDGGNGAFPLGSNIPVAGSLFGTTTAGGAMRSGAVIKLSR